VQLAPLQLSLQAEQNLAAKTDICKTFPTKLQVKSIEHGFILGMFLRCSQNRSMLVERQTIVYCTETILF